MALPATLESGRSRNDDDIALEPDLECVTRDGTILRADVYHPVDGARHPTLLNRTPYGKLEQRYVDNLLSMNFGIFETGRRLEWVYLMAADARRRAGEPFGPYTAAEATERWTNVERGKYIWWLPLDDIPPSVFSTLDAPLKTFHRAQNKEFMRFGELHERITVPVMLMTGWWDRLIGTVDNYVGLVANGPAHLRDRHRLIVGPWVHDVTRFSRHCGPFDFGPEAEWPYADMISRWYDFQLKGIDNGLGDEAPVQLFILGENTWRGEREWPLARTRYTEFFLRSRGHANTLRGDGWLSRGNGIGICCSCGAGQKGTSDMTIGVGGSTAEKELAAMTSMRGDVPPVGVEERLQRIARAQAIMREKGIDALYLDVSSSMVYFTGLNFRRTERMHSAVLPAKGDIVYVSPAFEVEKLKTMLSFGDKIAAWEEDDDPTAVVTETVRSLGYPNGVIAVDEATPFFTFDGLRRAGNSFTFVNAMDVTAGCRMIKSEHEVALMQTAKTITLAAHKAAARIMREGITTTEVQAFIAAAHKKLGSDGPPAFNGVLFGEATAYPHGVPYPQTLKDGDMILIDTGAPVDGYLSDITRSYVFGTPSQRQRDVWNLDKQAQGAGFAAAKPGNRCEDIDAAARGVITGAGFGPGYATPGLPHRTGHGIGLDVHEWPYLVKGDRTVLRPGMTFSNEPTICIYGEFGVRLEDHMLITETGARWFTEPAHSVDDPFGYEA